MADPSPPIELPEWEYIELYNVSDYPINLNEWKLTIGNSEYLFDESIEIQAKEYLILCDENAIDEFLVFGLCKDFSSFKVSNTGVNIALFDNKESLISSVDFDVSWHSSSYKEDGGWSLEQIDYDNPCAGKPNWSSSVCGDGGTPGECNSINNNNIIRPDIDYIYPLSNNSIAIHFNQNMNMESLLNTENYFIKEMQTNPKEINTITYKNDYIELIFGQEFQESNLYTLSINNIRKITFNSVNFDFFDEFKGVLTNRKTEFFCALGYCTFFEEVDKFLEGYLYLNKCNVEYVKYYMVLIYSHFISVNKENKEYQEFVKNLLTLIKELQNHKR